MRFLLTAVVAVLLVGFVAVPGPARADGGQADSGGQSPVRLDVTKVTPSIVDGSAPGQLTISGTLLNTSGRHMSGLQARVGRGEPAQTESAAQQALRGGKTSEQTPDTPVPGDIAPGKQLPFEVHVPLTGPGSVQLTQPGVYPGEISITGNSGGRATHLAGGDFLLPVLAPPGAPAPPPAHPPMPVSMMLPIVDYPRMEQKERPGQPTVLADDDLASSLQPGGRLFNLVKGLHAGLRPGSPTASAACMAIDPDLIDTASAIQDGYQVRQPDGSVRPGSGADAARRWLGELRDTVRGHCVVQLPAADADVSALARAGLPDLVRGSMDNYSSNVIRRTLDVEPRTDITWPVGGSLNAPAAKTLAGAGMRTALLRPEAMTTPNTSLRPAQLRDTGTNAMPIDPLMANALDPDYRSKPNQTAPSPPGADALSAQNALGALAFRGTTGFEPDSTSVITPPRRWNMGGADVTELLSGMDRLAKGGYIKPTPLPDSKSPTSQGSEPQTAVAGQQSQPGQPSQQGAQQPPPTAGLVYPNSATNEEIPQQVLQRLAKQNFKVGDLFRSSLKDPQVNLDPAEVTSPLRNGLLHGASAAWRGDSGTAQDWVDRGTNALDRTLSGVKVARIAPISLADSNSPIPVTVNNQLPITVSVRLRAPSPTGVAINIASMDRLRIPARGNQTVFVPANVQRPGPFTLNISATALSGTDLGTPTELQAESNVYGLVTRIITISAAVLLFVLSGRRVFRRIRKSRRAKGRDEVGPASATATTGPVIDPNEDTAEIVTTESDRHRG